MNQNLPNQGADNIRSKPESTTIPMKQTVLSIGDVISDRYTILSKIAETGLSAIYLAEDNRLERNVALKHVFKKSVNDDFKTLVKEAHLLSNISHPNVLTVHDCIAEDRGTYIISEFLEGDTLESYTKKYKLSIADSIPVLEQMLAGLAEVHSQSIVHGDLKPNNVMVRIKKNGKTHVTLLDFGLSHIRSDDPTSAAGLALQGSAYFMSPEEFNGTPKNVLSDIYSLGCLSYFAITGHYPFEGDNTMQIMASHLQHRLKEPSFHRPDLPKVLEQWLLWLMNLRPETRPASVQEALDMLHRCVEELNREKILATSALSTQDVAGTAEDMEWITIRSKALRSMAKLTNKQQASNFMVKIMKKHGFEKRDSVSRKFWRLIITDFYGLIPNRNKQAALLKEIESLLP